MACNLHAIEQMQLRERRRVDGVGHPKFDFHTEMDNWLPDVNKAWTATTPEGGFRAPSTLGGLGGANFPSSREEIWSFVAFAETLWDLGKPKFAGSFQNQGKRLLPYLPLRLYEIDDVVAALRAARTWADACDALLILSGVGDYVGGQALCTFFFGVCKGDVSRFAPNLDATTMKSFCLCGPGPEGVVKKMWGGVQLGKSEAVKRLAWLAENAEARFQALGLRFPFQQDADGKRKRLTAVDLEHALCYFSRYLSAHDSLKAAGARIVHDKLAGPIARGECPRPSIKWFAKLKEKTAAKMRDKRGRPGASGMEATRRRRARGANSTSSPSWRPPCPRRRGRRRRRGLSLLSPNEAKRPVAEAAARPAELARGGRTGTVTAAPS